MSDRMDYVYKDENGTEVLIETMDFEDCLELRNETGLSRGKFAEQIGIPYRTVQYWEKSGMPEYINRLLNYYVKGLILSGNGQTKPDYLFFTENGDCHTIEMLPDVVSGEDTGRYCRAFRSKTGLTKTDYAAELGTTKRTVFAWESGNTSLPGYVIRLLAYYVNCARKSGDKTRESAVNDEELLVRLLDEVRHGERQLSPMERRLLAYSSLLSKNR